ncbi:hypothetical protein SAMN05660337_0621 [Maridesulfovibrio ferrireducens]|uniref:Uncharacterized protein n=1 Tax=Maridesulfovibrio ferrireducens TaxID=246191 RepID=A0A1G9CBU7_9BACT|nr:hypothetical protein [Maridesulfovibrio ferrireducens]SDK49117.1 hypothetical protein SAMN05660337_0621 [Maridesulfovibrio ferrireducens]
MKGQRRKALKVSKATTEGGKAAVEALDKGADAAGEAVGKTVDEFKTNDKLQDATLTALGAGVLPIALASGIAAGPAVSSAAVAIANKVAMTPGAKEVIDFAKGANPISGTAPNPKSIFEGAGVIVSDLFQRYSK